MVIGATGNQGIYDALVGLHVFSAIIGFGAVAISGVYGAGARRPATPQRAEETARYFKSQNYAEHLVLAVPILGLAALGFRPGGADFGAVWVVAGLLIWTVAAALLLGVVRPAEAQLRAVSLTDGAQGQDDGARRAGSRLMWASAATDVLFVVALGFMVTQSR